MRRQPRIFMQPEGLRIGTCSAGADEAHHVLHALRMQPGQAVEVFDGAGRVGQGKLARLAADGLVVEVAEIANEPGPMPELVLATAVPKGKRWQALVEKCTELGADTIQPVLFSRSVARADGDPGKWRRWAIEACKQCRRPHVPVICPAIGLNDLLARPGGGARILAAPGGARLQSLLGQHKAPRSVQVIIGPEGGLTGVEERGCQEAGCALAALGPHILRIETAAMAACALVRALLHAERREVGEVI